MGTIILGSGISGISAGYHLEKAGEPVVIYEKDSDWGGLCGNFTIDGFRFDRFVHFTFTDDPYIKGIFQKSSPLYDHPSISTNYYKGYWLKHPAQNNLAPLPTEDKVQIIKGFINRKEKPVEQISDYEEWLRVQFGDYFAENFPFKYTRKYWGLEPKELETKWVGNRMHSPDLDEVLRGAFEVQDKNFYYTKYMRYPKNGGFRSILDDCRKGLDIRFNKEVVKIDPKDKVVTFKDGTTQNYTRLISSLPLPEIVKMIDGTPSEVVKAGDSLHNTCGYMISLGFKRPDVAKYLWFYIYDEDILSSRVYSPSLKSPDNVPEGCSSLQAEVFFDCKADIPKPEIVLKNTIEKLSKMGLFTEDEIVVKDIRFEKYANVTFDKAIYTNRQIVLDYLQSQGIESIGRFGKWEYMWTFQAFEDGMTCVNFNLFKDILIKAVNKEDFRFALRSLLSRLNDKNLKEAEGIISLDYVLKLVEAANFQAFIGNSEKKISSQLSAFVNSTSNRNKLLNMPFGEFLAISTQKGFNIGFGDNAVASANSFIF